MNWQYDRYHKWYTGSRGYGTFVVQKIKSGWMVARKPWTGDIQVISVYPNKAEAMERAAEFC